jgi:hypothetical protein
MVVGDYSPMARMTLWDALTGMESPMESLELGSTNNTEPTEDQVHIPRKLIGDWTTSATDPFPNIERIREYVEQDIDLWKSLNTDIRNEDYPRVLSTWPWPLNSETVLEMSLKTHIDIVNLALERTAQNGRHVMIAGGKSAKMGDKEAGLSVNRIEQLSLRLLVWMTQSSFTVSPNSTTKEAGSDVTKFPVRSNSGTNFGTNSSTQRPYLGTRNPALSLTKRSEIKQSRYSRKFINI